MAVPTELLYTKSHEWVKKLDNGNALVGITDHAQEAMGDLVFVELPQEDDTFSAGDSFAVVESVKAVSDVYCPIGGTVVAVNSDLEDDPAKINEDCYEAWLAEFKDIDLGDLLTAEEYEKVLAEGE